MWTAGLALIWTHLTWIRSLVTVDNLLSFLGSGAFFLVTVDDLMSFLGSGSSFWSLWMT